MRRRTKYPLPAILSDYWIWEATKWDAYRISAQPEQWLADIMTCHAIDNRINQAAAPTTGDGGMSLDEAFGHLPDPPVGG